MKTFNKTYLPDNVVYNKRTYTRTDKTTEIVLGELSLSTFLDTCKINNLSVIKVCVLSKNLRGKLDLNNKPYQPNEYYFIAPK